ncbi:efflux RND transporter permease subunit, partial [Arthrobacter sp. GCM10027362]|uniref:efflux RND transporter permease subunit n=1 Tax=Arthrobacter sp. GCM10027362 TaxID=3273379 RepID=UPI00362F600A
AAGAIALAALAALPLLAGGRPVVASVPDRTILVQWDAAPGTAGSEMHRIMAKASAELKTVEGVQAVGGHVGRAITSDTAADVNSGELWVTMRDGAGFDDVRTAVQEIVDGYPGLTNKVVTYPEQQIAAVREAGERGFAVRVYGVDLEIMRQKAEEIRQVLASTEGVANARVDVTVDQPVAEIEVDLAAAERHGIKPGDVRRAAATVLQGIEVGYLFEQQKVFQVVVKGSEQTRSSLTSVKELVINTPRGGHVRLGEVAEVKIAPNQTVIRHDDTSRRVDVVADIQGRNLADVKADVQAAISRMDFPVEYHAEIPPQYEERQASGQLVWWLAAAAALGLLVLLQTVLGSWRLAALTFVLLPVALLGGVAAAILAGGIGSLYSLAGFAAVLAIAVRDAVLLFGRFQRLQAASPQASRDALMRQAAGDRFVPTLLAALATALVLLPLVLFGGLVGTGTVLPLAVIVWGGLVTTTLLTLVVLPVLFLRFGPKERAGGEGSLLNPDEPVAQERQAVS